MGGFPLTSTESMIAAAPARHPWLRAALVIVAGYELWDALSNVPLIFADYENDAPVLRLAQTLILVNLALAPFVTAAALLFAVIGRLRHAIVALAVLELLTWLLDDLWSIYIHGLEVAATLGGAAVFAHHFVFPAAAIAAIVLALKERRLSLAVLLVSLPTLVKWIGIVLFNLAMWFYSY
jgi:hypothetical protein